MRKAILFLSCFFVVVMSSQALGSGFGTISYTTGHLTSWKPSNNALNTWNSAHADLCERSRTPPLSCFSIQWDVNLLKVFDFRKANHSNNSKLLQIAFAYLSNSNFISASSFNPFSNNKWLPLQKSAASCLFWFYCVVLSLHCCFFLFVLSTVGFCWQNYLHVLGLAILDIVPSKQTQMGVEWRGIRGCLWNDWQISEATA